MKSSETRHLLKKEFTLEFRNRYALFGVILYLVLIAFIVYLSLGSLAPETWTALYWISLLFVAITTVGRSFIQESPGRQLYYYSISSATSTVASKMLYNGLLMCLLAGANLLLFAVLADWPVEHSWLMPAIAGLGAIGFASAFTLMSSIAAKTHNNLGIMAILSIPIFIPMMLMLINCTAFALMPAPDWGDVYRNLGMLAALDVITITLALILFPYLWRD